MKVAIFSDTHLGFGFGTDRYAESFENAKHAVELCLAHSPDIILIIGDIFDSDIPTQETWHRTFPIFSPIKEQKRDAKLKRVKNGKEETINLSHIPVVAIHGTHEYRGKDFKNALEVLESAGCLVHLHANYVEFSKGDETLVVHGLGGVPEKKALDALQLWNPKPKENCTNILLLHQSLKDFLPFDDEMIATLAIENLPHGFDLIINGHLHWNSETKDNGIRLLLPGSTIITQMKKLEAGQEKAVCIYDTETKEIKTFPLPNQRKLFYGKIKFYSASPQEIKKTVEEKLNAFLSSVPQSTGQKKPLIRIKISGTLAKGVAPSDISFAEIEENFGERAILSIGKDLGITSFKKKMEELRELQNTKKSLPSIGIDILEKNLAETAFNNAFDTKRIFDLLAAGELDTVVELLSKKRENETEKPASTDASKNQMPAKEKQPSSGKLSDFVS